MYLGFVVDYFSHLEGVELTLHFCSSWGCVIYIISQDDNSGMRVIITSFHL